MVAGFEVRNGFLWVCMIVQCKPIPACFIADTMVCTGCCATLDHIVTYLFKQLTQKGMILFCLFRILGKA